MRLHPRDERAARRAMGPSPSQSTPSRHDRPDGTKRPLLDEPEDGRRRVQRRAPGEGSASCRRAPTPSVNGFEGRPARDWAGKAVRTAADPAQASLDECGTACGARTAGAPSAGESTSASRAWGKPRQHGLPREELGKPPDESLGFGKQVTGRRRFAPAQPATEQWPWLDVATKTRATHAPRRARSSVGEGQLPPAHGRPCARPSLAPNGWLDSRGVLGLVNGLRERAPVR